jgi:hypothetical protein
MIPVFQRDYTALEPNGTLNPSLPRSYDPVTPQIKRQSAKAVEFVTWPSAWRSRGDKTTGGLLPGVDLLCVDIVAKVPNCPAPIFLL